MTSRTANVFAWIDPDIKEQAEAILNQLGIPLPEAIGMFLKQVVLQRGIPFEVKLSVEKPVAIGSMTKEQIDRELQKGMDSLKSGKSYTSDEVEAMFSQEYGI